MFDLCSDSVPEMCGSYPEHIVSLIGDQQCQMYFHVCHWASRRTKEKNTPYVLHQLAMARFAWAVDNLKHRQYTSKTKMMTWRVQNVFASVCVCVFLSKNYPPCKRNQSEGSGLRNARAMLVSHLPRRITVSRLGDTWGWMHTCFFWVHACSNIVYAGQNAICQVSLDFGVHNQWCHREMWYWTSEGPAVCHMRAEPWTN